MTQSWKIPNSTSPENSHWLFYSELIKSSLIFLENQTDFLAAISSKVPENEVRQLFLQMSSQSGFLRDRLSSYQRRRDRQVSGDAQLHVRRNDYILLRALMDQPWLQKAKIGRTYGARITSRSEAIQVTMYYCLLGLEYFHNFPRAASSRFLSIVLDVIMILQCNLMELINLAKTKQLKAHEDALPK